MDLRLLTLCVAAALLAVCHSCSTGREFITGFITNYQKAQKDTLQLHLVLTAQDVPATVHIQVASKFSKKLTLRPQESQWVSLPNEFELQKQFHNPNSAIRISSSADIAVVSHSRRYATGDGAVISPIQNLGTEHYVFTPTGTMPTFDKLVGIVNGDSPNTITILPAKNVNLRGNTLLKKGVAVTFTLQPYDSFLIRSHSCLTGSKITSTKPVAVLVGHQCLALGSKCEHVYEQIPPVAKMAKEFIVPFTGGSKTKNYAVIVSGEDDADLTLLQGHTPKKHSLKLAGSSLSLTLSTDHPLVVKSSKKVMVLLVSGNEPNNPFLITLTPQCKMFTDWTVDTINNFENWVSIVSETDGAGSVKVYKDGKFLANPKWNKIVGDKQWVWAILNLGTRQNHFLVKGESSMAVYAFGGKQHYGYGYAGVCSGESPPPPPPKDPCEDVNCREKERCVNGKCQAVSTATCSAMGDPHYRTFDGRPYDFQGTCTYIVATVVKKGTGLPDFTITTKNDHRGSKRVSYVRTVTVTAYAQTITISKYRGKVEVNGELYYLPVRLLEDKITVRQSGIYCVLMTDFGLVVKYDWNMRLIITVPSSYHNHLGGLCGNYNGDKRDDLPEPNGKSMTSVLEMIKDWKVKDSDLFCHDNCAGQCPNCAEEQQEHYRSPNRCGMMAQEDGPFKACHSAVSPATFLDDCVYDVCVNRGSKQFLCESLKSYFDQCLSEGVNITAKWRDQSGCIPSCPRGSHYEACGSACPASCSDLDSEKLCKAPCVEGCQCDKGYVLSGDRCVPKSECGCQDNGKYYPAGAKWWGDTTCTTSCECHNGKTKCKSVSCRKSEHCTIRKGVRNCYPTSFATCRCSGDPHCLSLDNRRFDFQGSCSYVLSKLVKGSEQDLEPFEVLVENEHRGRNRAVSWTKAVSLTVYGNVTVSMNRVNKGQVLVNGRSVNLPFSGFEGKLDIYREGSFCLVKTDFDLTLRFDWRSHVSLTLPSSYAGETAGLCGNYNGKPADDFIKSDGTLTENVNEFGDSWKAGGDKDCSSDCPGGQCPECKQELMVRYQNKLFCGIISDKEGPFSQCHEKFDPTPFLNDCVFDLCAYNGHASALCDSLSAFTTACQQGGAQVESWRTQKLCPMSCGPNSHYEVCAPPCQPTCSNLGPPDGCDEKAPCTEACVCDDDFILSNGRCVSTAECGCQYEGQYYEDGQVFFPGQSCDTRCVCSDGGRVECDSSFKCSPQEECVLKDGSFSCQPKGVGSCSVSGVRNIRPFDGQDYPLWGNCLFTLSKVQKAEGEIKAFSVQVQQKTDKDGHVTRNVIVKVDNQEIAMETGVISEVKIEGIRVSLPALLEEEAIRLYQNGFNIIVETDFGLRVTYDTVSGVVVQLPSTYQGAPSGLCGNYNDDASDDLGEAKGDPQKAAATWVVEDDDDDVKCDTSCGATTCPGPDDQKKPDAEKACDIIKAPQGPFEGCHATINPEAYYDACVRDTSTTEGGDKVLCRHIQTYVTACQLDGAKIKEWRNETFCPMKCPKGSHYELCTSTWTTSCYSLEVAFSPVCQEGCECDDDLMFDGAECVPVEKCGCVRDGLYYKSGSTVLLDGCSDICSCESGVFSCKETSCQEEEECRNVDGVMACVNPDPCADIRCRVKEHCEVSEDGPQCVPDSKALCWAFGDPHYSTFDGQTYSFQGTCSYVLVKTTGADSSLPELTITTKNEFQRNSDGSFVRSVSVQILSYTIDIISGDRDHIVLNGEKTVLPIELDEGSISITQSGIRGTIMTDFGVEITFDWTTLVMVSLSSSFYGNVGGLCGTYNGDKADDMTTSKGNVTNDVIEWAKSWSVPDGDPLCYHECKENCPQCSREDQKRYSGPEFCGILSDETGPFSFCHSKLPVAEFVSDCVFDLCANDGRQEVLCEALSLYTAECQEQNVIVFPWRDKSGCPPPCPENSHYEECGSACPPGCGPPPEVCPEVCVEGCFCDEGFVRVGKECVKKEEGCGCHHDGHYYQPGQEFWGDSECSEKCLCDPVTKQVQCNAVGCQRGETCSVIDGVRDCYPQIFKTCTARGDPHFTSYDGKKFDFQGTCVYRLSSVCVDNKDLKHFEVTLENNNRGNKRVSYAKVVTVNVFNRTFTLSYENPGKVLVGGEEESLPYSLDQPPVQAYRRHQHAVIETHFIRVSYDFRSSVRVELAESYENSVCGLCGNMNGDASDDLMLPDGTQASDANKFGEGHLVAEVEGCSPECKDCAQPLPPDFKPPDYTKICDIITEKTGPLAGCFKVLDPEAFHHDCVYDMYVNGGKEELGCDIISNYVDQCQLKGAEVKPWRKDDLCPMKCPENSRYNFTAPGCPATCTSRSAPAHCRITPAEGCVCNHGYLQSEDRCVKLSECGCQVGAHYLQNGEFFMNNSCKRSYKCSKGKLIIRRQSCRRRQKCAVVNGKRGCYNKRQLRRSQNQIDD